MVNGAVADASRYVLHGELNVDPGDVPEEVVAFAEARAREHAPHPIFVMDVALTDEGYRIIECNCFNGTGFYGHNIERIVEAVSGYLRTQQP